MIRELVIDEIDLTNSLYETTSKQAMQLEQPQAHFQWLSKNNIEACASIWWQNTPTYQTESTGLIGHFSCNTVEAGASLLIELKTILLDKGGDWVIGPINANSWFKYRLSLTASEKPSFFLEPWQSPEQLGAFELAEFNIIERYVSSLQPNLKLTDTRVPKVRTRLKNTGVCYRTLNHQNLQAELQNVYHLCLQSFADNILYQAISFEVFSALYSGLLSKVPAEFCQCAYLDDELIGFIFAYPSNEDLIVKTVAVKNSKTLMGLSLVLLDNLFAAVKGTGLKNTIYALMHSHNRSLNTAARFAEPFQHYGLMGFHR